MYKRFQKPGQFFLIPPCAISLLICFTLSLANAKAPLNAANLPLPAIEAALSAYKNIETLSSRFTQKKHLVAMDLVLPSAGVFRLRLGEDKKREVDWVVEKPSYLRIRLHSNGIEAFEAPEGPGRVLVEGSELATKALKPLLAWITMDAKKIDEEFFVSAQGKNQFILKPKAEGNNSISEIAVRLGKQKLVESIRLQEKSGDFLEIKFSSTRLGP